MRFSFKSNPSWRRTLAPGDRRFWLLRSAALRIKIEARPIWEIEFYWKRLLLGGAMLAVAGYLALATAVWAWWDRNPHNQVRWRDIALAPVDWDGLRTRRGDTAILTALERLRKEEYVEAIYGLRMGLARSPANIPGRLALARLLAGSNPAHALAIMESGLRYATDAEYFRVLFGFYGQYGAHAVAVERARELLSTTRTPPLSEATRSVIGIAAAAALLDSGQPAAAGDFLAKFEPATDDDRKRRQLMQFTALLRQQRFDEARRIYAADSALTFTEQAGAEGDLALSQHDPGAFRLAVDKLLAASPNEPATFLYALRGWHQLKQPGQRDLVETDFYDRFSTSDAALQLLAATAVNLALPEVVRRAESVAQRNRLSGFAFRVHLTELALRVGDFEAAPALLRDWEGQLPTLGERQRTYPTFIAELARATASGANATASGLLEHLAGERPTPAPALFEFAARTLVAARKNTPAKEAVEIGLRLYAGNDALLALRGKIAADEKRVAEEHVDSAVTAPVVDEFAALAMDRAAALAALDAWAAAGEMRTAERFLAYLQKRAPAWLAAGKNEIAAREVPLRFALQQRPLALAAFRDLMRRAGQPRALAFKVVRDANSRGETEIARELLREAMRLLPDDPSVAKLAEELK